MEIFNNKISCRLTINLVNKLGSPLIIMSNVFNTNTDFKQFLDESECHTFCCVLIVAFFSSNIGCISNTFVFKLSLSFPCKNNTFRCSKLSNQFFKVILHSFHAFFHNVFCKSLSHRPSLMSTRASNSNH